MVIGGTSGTISAHGARESGGSACASITPWSHVRAVDSTAGQYSSPRALDFTCHLYMSLGALGRMIRSVRVRLSVARSGVVLCLTRLTRSAGGAVLDFTLDAPSFAAGLPLWREMLVDVRGHALAVSGSDTGTCSAPPSTGARMHCALGYSFTPLPRGTRLLFSVTLTGPTGRGVLPGAPWRLGFAMP